MSLTKIIESIQKEALQMREDERRILEEIAAVSTVEFAEQAAAVLDPKNHIYGFEAYLVLLENLKTLLLAGMPPDMALDSAQTGWSIEKILDIWRYGNE